MADLPENMPVVEIGPGLGTLTRKLLEGGHEVHAIEIDRTLFANLEKSLDSYLKNKQLTLTHGDAVKLPLASLPEEQTNYAVVANLPYAISSAWLESLLATERLPGRMVLMLQREAIERMGQMRIKKLQRSFHLSARGLPPPQISPRFQAMLSSRTLRGLGPRKNGSPGRAFPFLRNP